MSEYSDASSESSDEPQPKVIGVILFDGFETLDVYGPLGLLTSPASLAPYTAVMIGPPNSQMNTVLSSSGLPTPFSRRLQWPYQEKFDVLLIPGGFENQPLLQDHDYLILLRQVANHVIETGGMIFCVCTGSILLAAAGVLCGHEATTNKAAFDKLTPEYDEVHWIKRARWVHDHDIITSSGITAGMV